MLREYRHEVTVHEGLEFQNKISGKEIFSVIEQYRVVKMTQDVYKETNNPLYNLEARQAAKLLSNSLSGKVIERNHADMTQICRSHSEVNEFILKAQADTVMIHIANARFVVLSAKKQAVYSQKQAKPSYLGV